ncbi:MAG: TetR/AcrR family transcriptional regulator [Firmicutes bacterium]|nr:TetR/AcrR family transcriptional regulator [Bacillota bacterium]
MEKKPYHHGDLRNKLIERGIEMLSEEGAQDFSLRKLAAKCGVSHTAPYSHFESVDKLRQAMGEHVAHQFMEKLRGSVQHAEDSTAAVTSLGKAYISFFSENPLYFQFLFYHSGLSIDFDEKTQSDYQPFTFFKETAYRMFDALGLPKEDYLNNLIALWSMVHGIASLLTNKGVRYSGDWSEVLSNNTIFARRKEF